MCEMSEAQWYQSVVQACVMGLPVTEIKAIKHRAGLAASGSLFIGAIRVNQNVNTISCAVQWLYMRDPNNSAQIADKTCLVHTTTHTCKVTQKQLGLVTESG